jgi:hypothetical protein
MSYLQEGSFGKFALQDVAGKSAVVFQDGKIILVTDGFVKFTSFNTDDIIALGKKAE